MELIAVIGKTGSGKDTLVDELCKIYKLQKVCSYANYPPRSDQVDGVDHYFVSDYEFDNIMETQNVLAYVKFHDTGKRYCTTEESLAKQYKDDTALAYIIDPNGLEYLKQHTTKFHITSFLIFTDEYTRHSRLAKRNGTVDHLREEAEHAIFDPFIDKHLYDHIVYNNDDITTAIRQFEPELDKLLIRR